MKKKTTTDDQILFDIDYDMFTTDEIIKIYNFYNLMIKHHKKPMNKDKVLTAYREYKNIINNISLEKKYNKEFEKCTGISIYQEISKLK